MISENPHADVNEYQNGDLEESNHVKKIKLTLLGVLKYLEKRGKEK